MADGTQQTITMTGDAYIPVFGISAENGDIIYYRIGDGGQAILDKVEKGESLPKKSKKEVS